MTSRIAQMEPISSRVSRGRRKTLAVAALAGVLTFARASYVLINATDATSSQLVVSVVFDPFVIITVVVCGVVRVVLR